MRYVPEWFPGATFKRKGKEWYKASKEMVNAPFEVTKDKIVSLYPSNRATF